MDGHDGVLAIVLAAEHLLDLGSLHLLIEAVERLAELRVDGFARLGPFNEHAKIVALLAKRLNQIAVLFEASPPLEHFLRFGLVFPEIGVGGACLEPSQFFVWAGRFKDSSADRQRVWSNPRSDASTRQQWAYQNVPLSLNSFTFRSSNHEVTKSAKMS
jgi:hypothetical protein